MLCRAIIDTFDKIILISSKRDKWDLKLVELVSEMCQFKES